MDRWKVNKDIRYPVTITMYTCHHCSVIIDVLKQRKVLTQPELKNISMYIYKVSWYHHIYLLSAITYNYMHQIFGRIVKLLLTVFMEKIRSVKNIREKLTKFGCRILSELTLVTIYKITIDVNKTQKTLLYEVQVRRSN